MLGDENRHRDKDSKHENQGGSPDAASARQEIARAAAVRQFGGRSGAAAGRLSREEAHRVRVSGWAVAGLGKAVVWKDQVGSRGGPPGGCGLPGC